jgi:carboxypeptidase Q
MDLYDRLQQPDLMQASAIMAAMVYDTAVRGERLPRKVLPKPEPKKKPESSDKDKKDVTVTTGN